MNAKQIRSVTEVRDHLEAWAETAERIARGTRSKVTESDQRNIAGNYRNLIATLDTVLAAEAS